MLQLTPPQEEIEHYQSELKKAEETEDTHSVLIYKCILGRLGIKASDASTVTPL